LHQCGQPHLLRPGDFHDAVHRRGQRGVRHGQGHVVGRNRLHKGGREPHVVALRARLHDAAQEFKELRAVDDGVGNTARLDQRFLRDLAAKIAAFGQAMRAHHRQCHVVPHPGARFGGQQVAPRRLEEFQHGVVFKRGRIGHVDHGVHAHQRAIQAHARDGVHAGGGRGGDGLVAAFDKPLH